MQTAVRDRVQVLQWLIQRNVHEYLDVAGRPLGEGRATAFREVPTEMQLCPYPGSRYHHVKRMNVTALRQMPPWQDLLSMLSWLSQRHRLRHQRNVATYDDLAQVTGAGVFLADFLVLRARNPLCSRAIPLLISSLYKLCLGFQLAYLPERYADLTLPKRLPASAEFYAYLETNELLIGEAEVCSGSPVMITQAYEALTDERAVASDALPPACESLQIDWERFDVFTDKAATIWHDLTVYVLRAPEFLPQLSDARLPVKLQDALNMHLKQRGAELLAEQTGLIADIARAARLYCDHPAEVRPSQPIATLPATHTPSALAPVVLSWLRAAAGEQMKSFASVVRSAIEAQVAAYDSYEAAVLTGLDQHLSVLMKTLGFDGDDTALTPRVLSQICGRTLRDWDAAPR